MSNKELPPTSPFSDERRLLPHRGTDAEGEDREHSIRIPNYRLEECVGTGGFGRVYRAVRATDGHVVAVKLLHVANGISNDLRQRFLREATVLCQLNHPRIVAFRELGISGNDLYLVMDYIESTGWSVLSRKLNIAKRISLAAGIVDHCLDAMVYAHAKGIVHRDVKPSNILLESRDGKLRVWLGDFGLAKNYLQAGSSGMTSDHEIAGTLNYLAPELLDGVKYFRPASDQYSLAATLYEMISGRPPIVIPPGGNPMFEIRRHAIRRIEELVPEIPPPLAEWIHCGLQTKPEHRFRSTQSMRDQLRLALPPRSRQ
jgi:eukaryotic-like serine/threonine-protein kinase